MIIPPLRVLQPVARECGSCNLCCKVMGIEELKKPGGEWCDHALKGGGCNIYGEHPHSCQIFKCTWLMGKVSDNYHPRKIHAVLYNPEGNMEHLRVLVDPAHPEAPQQEPLQSLIVELAKRIPVMVIVGDNHWAFGPPHLLERLEKQYGMVRHPAIDCQEKKPE